LTIKNRQPDLPVYIFYRDMMTYGFNETYFTQARQAGVIFFQFTTDMPPQVSLVDTHPPGVRISVIDPILGRPIEVTVSLLALATGITADLPQHCPQMIGIRADDMGFFAEADPKWRPVDSQTEGVFACGLALGPRSIPETSASARAAAQRALNLLIRPRISAGTRIALQRRSLCTQCERCIQACAFDARHLDPDTGVITVHPAMCQGCGACMAVCPNGAAILRDCPPAQMLNIIETTLHAGAHTQGADA
jgi:heterodisulfide reductase subunit A